MVPRVVPAVTCLPIETSIRTILAFRGVRVTACSEYEVPMGRIVKRQADGITVTVFS